MLRFEVDASKVASGIEQKMSRVTEVMRAQLNGIDIELQSYIITHKLSGDPIQQRRGARGLAGTIRAIPAVVEGETVTGEVQGGGGVAPYGKFLEYGTQGPYEIVPKNAKALAFSIGGQMRFFKKVMHPGLTEHSFMRSSLRENQENIVTQMKEALMGVVQS